MFTEFSCIGYIQAFRRESRPSQCLSRERIDPFLSSPKHSSFRESSKDMYASSRSLMRRSRQYSQLFAQKWLGCATVRRHARTGDCASAGTLRDRQHHQPLRGVLYPPERSHHLHAPNSPFRADQQRLAASSPSRREHVLHLQVGSLSLPFLVVAITISSSVRCTTSSTTRKNVCIPAPRSATVLFPTLQPGMRVQRGPDWQWTDQDGGVGHLGTGMTIKEWKGFPMGGVRVHWDDMTTGNTYRYGGENCYDVVL